jgi:hypothetical protein
MKLQQERVQLTAVAVQQGWAAQLDRDIAAARRAVSTLKERALFTTARELRELEDKARRLDGLIAQHSEDRAAAALVFMNVIITRPWAVAITCDGTLQLINR